MKRLLLFIALTLSITLSAQSIIYVDVNVSGGNNDGTSWENAYYNLQNIPTTISGSHEVWVAQGTYKPGTLETDSFVIPENFTVLGGFNGTETNAEQRDWATNKTILSGDLNSNNTADTSDSHSIVTMVQNNITLDGFSIEYAFADGTENTPVAIGRSGAGVYNSGNNNIYNCIFHHLNAQGDATNGIGGALVSFSGALHIINSLFFNNTASANGGAISIEGGTTTLTNCTVPNNTATKGGGVHFFDGNLVAVNSIFTNNSGTNGNINDDNPSGGGTGTVSYSLFFNSTTGNNGNLPPNIIDGGNNLYNIDPIYIGGYWLANNSPIIDAGNNTANSFTKDLAANPRIIDGDLNSTTTIDIGAFEYKPSFIDSGINLTEVNKSSVVWGDYDNDGDLDILLTGDTGDFNAISKIYTNNAGSFTELTTANLIGVYNSSVAWGDYDNDGDLDILLTGNDGSNGISKIYTNNGNSSFTELTSANLTGVSSSSVAWGDYDNDGDLDILLTGDTGLFNGISKIYTNNGDSTFTVLISANLTGVNASSVAWGDYDNDGDLDILLTGNTGSSGSARISKIYTNNGNSSFTELTSANLTGVSSSSVAWGDYDNDGDLDILLIGWTGSGRISKIYTNNTGSFTELTSANLLSVFGSSATWGDYDNDGDLDILLTGDSSSGFSTLRNPISKIYTNSAGNFTELTTANLKDVRTSSVAWGDYDNDGDLDILLTGNPHTSSNSFAFSKIYTNASLAANTAPTVPTAPIASVNANNTVTLSWSASTDAETPSEGLSYNVYIKENPVGSPIYTKSPMAQENDGWRKLPVLGNAMQNTNYTWKVPKRYCGKSTDFVFKVQAIDHNFAGSAFSAEGSFTASPTAKIIYVNESSSAGGDGTSWTMAYNNLQDALNDVTGLCDEIWVATGTYKPTSGADQAIAFEIPEGITILGGFNGTETTADTRNWAENETILSGDIGTPNDATDNSYTILKLLKNDVTIGGFIIQDATATADAGIFDDQLGAGVYSWLANNATVKNCVFRNLSANLGAALYHRQGVNAKYINCLFYNNTAVSGNPIFIDVDNVDFINCSIVDNTASTTGKGMLGNYKARVTLTNTIVAGNHDTSTNPNTELTSSGSFTINYSYLKNENPPGTTNINGTTVTDPMFTDAANNEYSLQNGSPLVDTGDSSVNMETKDLSNHARIANATIDIGAYEYQNTLNINKNDTSTFSVYPNPVKNNLNVKTTIKNYTYKVYNIQGQEILKAHNSTSNTIDVSKLPSGIYVLKLSSNNKSQNFKIIKQ